ncbi:hypothetical protein ACFQFQ_07270 [Sulfitobacter porphyrae]|uniref:Uncharacterized protein n=1 Tax=Sulfitobacter porphyrae TaxID=1246864 RepID=A0ABW2B0X6_9RHOB
MSLLGVAASVVMVGHSLFGSDGPDMLQEALRAGMGQGIVRAQIINGAPLKYNWDDPPMPKGSTRALSCRRAAPPT